METVLLKLGTRKSLLAWAQSSAVARDLTKNHPHVKVELVGIETKGDIILDKPLSQIEGKEFFSAELDLALLNGEVDFTVHSMKDLSLERPSALKTAAIPARELQHDIVIFNANVTDRLLQGKPIRIGTSSPRRLTIIPDFLKKALPHTSTLGPTLDFKEIRGNVNTRISRIHEPETSDRKLDAVILAFAGIERLSHTEELSKLLQNTRFIILPLIDCPSAPAQGALMIETRADRADVLNYFSCLHDQATAENVQKEREILKEWGGGCHLKLGASQIGNHLHVKGQKPSGEWVDEIRGKTPVTLPPEYLKVDTSEIFNFESHTPDESSLEKSKALFIAHHRAFDFLSDAFKEKLKNSLKPIWVSGTSSWFKLAAKGLWIEGCTEGQGVKALEIFTAKKLLAGRAWALLTHAESLAMSPHFSFKISPVATYQHRYRHTPQTIIQASHLYWASGLTFNTILENIKSPEEKAIFLKKSHACGPGRTLMVLRSHGIEPKMIITPKE